MKSRKKTNKLNLLIGLNKGIASVQSLELAMLFSHAGFNIQTILLGNEETYVAPEAIKEITGHAPWCKESKPSWVKAEINYSGAIIVEPDKETQSLILSDCLPSMEEHPHILYIKNHSKRITILQKKERLEHISTNTPNKEIVPLPSSPLKFRGFFQEIFSKTVKLAASEAIEKKISYYFSGDWSQTIDTCKLRQALESDDIKEDRLLAIGNNEKTAMGSQLIISDGEKRIEVELENQSEEIYPSRHRVYLSKHKNGLVLKDLNGIRLLPEFTCQSCYARLVSYLKTELSRKKIL